MLKRMLAALLALCALVVCLPLEASAARGDLRVEQALTQLPAGKAFFYIEGETSNTADVSLALGSDTLTVTDVRRADPAKDPGDYYFILDGAAGYAQMEAMKGAVGTFVDRYMAGGDKLTLIVAGREARTLLEKAQNKDEIKTALGQLYGGDYGQTLFDAMAGCTAVTAEEGDAMRRKVAFVFTSPQSTELDQRSDGEIAGTFGAGGLPYYTFAFENGSKDTEDNLGVLARATGAGFSVSDESNFDNNFSTVMKEIQGAFVAEFTADSNRIAGTPQALNITDNLSGEEASLEVPVRFWAPDSEAPKILEITQTATDTLELTFSEAVAGAGQPESYRVQDDAGQEMALASAAYQQDTLTATLTLESAAYEGRMSVAGPGITDVSREENPLSGSATLYFTGEAPAAERASLWPWLLLAAVVIALAVVLIAARRRGGPRGQKPALGPEEPAGPQDAPPLAAAHLELTGGAAPGKSHPLPTGAPLFCGSGAVCQLSFEGSALSRQHFAVEGRSGGYILTPLSASGVTTLNGAPVTAPAPLQPGDRIEAGGMVFVFQIDA